MKLVLSSKPFLSLTTYGVYWLPVFLMFLSLPLIGNPSTWLTLTMAGLAMGMMLFMMAVGLSLVFGLMDVMNFGHSAFVSLGAFVAATILSLLNSWLTADSVMISLLALLLAITGAMMVGALSGWVFETVIVRPVYGDHLRQILITVGALIVGEQIIMMLWGSSPTTVARPSFLEGSLILGGASIEYYRIFAVILGLIVYSLVYALLNSTRLGLLVRAGVENREMVAALGFRIQRLFILVFVLGSALAAMGGAMWAGYETLISPNLGQEMMIVVFIVVIIGGLGSIQGTLLGAMMVGLTGNYIAFIAPKLALSSSMILMIIILLWRPNGLKPGVR